MCSSPSSPISSSPGWIRAPKRSSTRWCPLGRRERTRRARLPRSVHRPSRLIVTPRALTPIEVIAAVSGVVMLVCALIPNVVSPHAPLAVDPANAFQPPTAAHLFGTDESGRDVLSRVIHGTRESLTIGVLATLAG